jgi:hypothetical protein
MHLRFDDLAFRPDGAIQGSSESFDDGMGMWVLDRFFLFARSMGNLIYRGRRWRFLKCENIGVMFVIYFKRELELYNVASVSGVCA